MGRRAAFAIFVLFLVVMMLPLGDRIVIDTPHSTGAGLTIIGSFASLGLAAFAVFFPREDEKQTIYPALFVNRICAGLIDMVAIGLAVISVSELFEVGLEAFVTGNFATDIVRDYSRSYDGLTFPVIFGAMFSGYCYFWMLPRAGKATLGQYVMGYRAVPAFEFGNPPNFAIRAIAGIFCFIAWPFALVSLAGPGSEPGRAWWDRVSGTKAVAVD